MWTWHACHGLSVRHIEQLFVYVSLRLYDRFACVPLTFGVGASGVCVCEASAERTARLCAVGLSTRAMCSRPAYDAFRHAPSSVSCECRHRANAGASLAMQSGSGCSSLDCEEPNPRSPSGVVVTGIPRPIAFTWSSAVMSHRTYEWDITAR